MTFAIKANKPTEAIVEMVLAEFVLKYLSLQPSGLHSNTESELEAATPFVVRRIRASVHSPAPREILAVNDWHELSEYSREVYSGVTILPLRVIFM